MSMEGTCTETKKSNGEASHKRWGRTPAQIAQPRILHVIPTNRLCVAFDADVGPAFPYHRTARPKPPLCRET